MFSFLLKLEKKNRFLIHALIFAAYNYLVVTGRVDLTGFFRYIIPGIAFIGLTYVTHFPNLKLKNILMAMLMPLSVLAGSIMSFHYFPNLGSLFKIFTILAFAGLDYLILLIDNIFLVVEDRQELIPLYRVAVTWSLILQIVVAMPLFAGIFKFNINSFYQSAIVSAVAFVYCLYQIWASRYDQDAKNTGVVERIYLSLIVAYFVFSSSLGVSFFPTEAFLKALFTATVCMFGLSYTSSYLKNEITRKMIIQYCLIVLLFLLITIIFKP